MSSIESTSSASGQPRVIDWGRYALVGLGTIVAAVIANVLIYFIASVIVGFEPTFVVLANVSPTILFTVVPAVVAVLVYAVLLRVASDPARTFTIVAVVALVISLIPDMTYIPTVPGATVGQTAVLMLMHVAAAVVIVSMLTTLARPAPR